MDFKDLQKKVVTRAVQYGKENKIKIDSDYAILKLYEELWEFTQAVLIHTKKSRPRKIMKKTDSQNLLAKELADVVCLAILNAYLLDVDLESAIKDKWFSKL